MPPCGYVKCCINVSYTMDIFATQIEIRQTAKFKSPPNKPLIWYVSNIATYYTSLQTINLHIATFFSVSSSNSKFNCSFCLFK